MKKYQVFLNLEESPFIIDMAPDLQFRFSSEFNFNRYNDRVYDFITEQTARFTARHGIETDFDYLYAVAFYRAIEKRGCYIRTGEGVVTSWQNLKFGGQVKTKRN